jgi:multimeric flavodoxin WrbA
MKMLGIIGSPRKGGNIDTLIEQVLAGARAHGADTDKLYLDDLRIRPCQACFSWTDTANASPRTTFNGWWSS